MAVWGRGDGMWYMSLYGNIHKLILVDIIQSEPLTVLNLEARSVVSNLNIKKKRIIV